MSWPTVVVNQLNQLNQLQGESKEVERRYLFIGYASKNKGKIISVNADTDFDEVLGVTDSALKKGLKAALDNAGQGWFGSVAILGENETWDEVAIKAQDVGSFECIVYAENVNEQSEINKAITLRSTLISKFGRWSRVILGIKGIDISETWSDFESRLANLQKNIADYGVTLIPILWGNEPFVNAGRACNRSVSIADSVARVQTGALKSMGSDKRPIDSEGIELSLATLQTLEGLRYSVPMWYPALDGYYWSDDRTLDVETGDYQSAETVRVVDKVARRILLKAIAKVADRSFNSSSISIKSNEQYFSSDLREMSKSVQINGVQFPGEVKAPKDGDITIQWINRKEVKLYVQVRVTDIPLKITINLMVNNQLDSE